MCSRDDDVRIVKRVCVRQLRMDAKEAELPHSWLVRHLTVEHGWQVEAAEVPDNVEQVVNGTSDRIIRHHSCNI